MPWTFLNARSELVLSTKMIRNYCKSYNLFWKWSVLVSQKKLEASLTLYLLVSSADNLCKQLGLR